LGVTSTQDPPSVDRVADTANQAGGLQPVDDRGHRPRRQAHLCADLAGADPARPLDDVDDPPLGPIDPPVGGNRPIEQILVGVPAADLFDLLGNALLARTS
jgi:hypothetical protein